MKWKSKKNKIKKVDFFILGAQKCGTTSLHFYLSQHPLLLGSFPKEVDFFSFDGLYSKGIDWYHQCFDIDSKSKKALKFDSSTEYLYLPYCATRIKEYNSDAKFIIIKRNPLERAISAYKMYKQLSEGALWSKSYRNKLGFNNESLRNEMMSLLNEKPFPDFTTLIKKEFDILSHHNEGFHYEPSLISRGDYNKQLEPYYGNFPKENIYEIDFNIYKNNTTEVLNEILIFLGINKNKFDESYDFSTQLKSTSSLDLNSTDFTYLNSIFNKVYKKTNDH